MQNQFQLSPEHRAPSWRFYFRALSLFRPIKDDRIRSSLDRRLLNSWSGNNVSVKNHWSCLAHTADCACFSHPTFWLPLTRWRIPLHNYGLLYRGKENKEETLVLLTQGNTLIYTVHCYITHYKYSVPPILSVQYRTCPLFLSWLWLGEKKMGTR